MLKLTDFDYNLPKNLIASKPHEPRDRCKLLAYNRKNQQIKHTRFDKILNFLKPGDVLVLNDTKVIPARLIGRRIDEQGKLGRKFKILLLKEIKNGEWEILIDGKNRQVGLKIDFGKGLIGEIAKWKGGGKWEMKFNKTGKKFQELISKFGKMPLPPYIKQFASAGLRRDKRWYQTVYAKYLGSVAAPTAGLHFTKELLKKLKQKGVQLECVTLHVGLGTFMPVKAENIVKHKMHPEYIEISAKTAGVLNKAKKEGRRIVAVGTTTTRALESAAICHPELVSGSDGFRNKFGMTSKIFKIKPFKGEVNIFIYPPYKFKFVDALITNFHLPKSTLLMMVSAFIGQKLKPEQSTNLLRQIYQQALNKNYKLYSYGDAMLIL